MRLEIVTLIIAIESESGIETGCGLVIHHFGNQVFGSFPKHSIDRFADHPVDVLVVSDFMRERNGRILMKSKPFSDLYDRIGFGVRQMSTPE